MSSTPVTDVNGEASTSLARIAHTVGTNTNDAAAFASVGV